MTTLDTHVQDLGMPGNPISAAVATTVASVVSTSMHATSSAAAIRLVLGLLFLYNVDDLVRHSEVLYLETVSKAYQRRRLETDCATANIDLW